MGNKSLKQQNNKLYKIMARQKQTSVTVGSFLIAVTSVAQYELLKGVQIVNNTVTTPKSREEIAAESAEYLAANPNDFSGLIATIQKTKTETFAFTVGDLISCKTGKNGKFSREMLVEDNHPALTEMVNFTASGLKNRVIECFTKTTELEVAEFCKAFKMAETETEIPAPPVSVE